MKFCIPTAITFMALSFCSAAVDVALRGSVAHENDIAELDLATLKHAGEYLPHTLDGTSTDANLIAPLVTDLKWGIISGASYAIKSVAHNTYIKALPGGEHAEVYTQDYIGAWERFTIEHLGNYWYSIKSEAHGTYLRAGYYTGFYGEYPDIRQQTYVGSQEKFKPKFINDEVVLQTAFGTYVRADHHKVVDTQTYSGSYERFELVRLD